MFSGFKLRLNVVFFSLLLFALALLAKLFFIQVKNFTFYRALAEGQQKWFAEEQGRRGKIFFQDKNGNLALAATNKTVVSCLWQPQSSTDQEEILQLISSVFDLEQKELLDKIKDSQEEKISILLKKDLTEQEIKELQEKDIPGLVLVRENRRYYPYQELAAATLGFVGGEGIGQYGIEGYFEEKLRGETGWRAGEKNPWGFSIDLMQDESRQGADLVLTLDQNIEQKAEELLAQARDNFDIESGEIIVMQPATGKILALANYPSFNLNQYSQVKEAVVFQNSAVQKLFEPGSVLKPFVMAGALNEGKITPETTYIDEGKVQIGSYLITNYDGKVWGKQTMAQVLEKSINTGALFAQRQLGGSKFLDYLEKFGFFSPTYIELQGEIASENKNLKSKREINLATASFGQGIEITSIQLARAFSAIANGGNLLKPLIVDKIIAPDGTFEKTHPVIQGANILTKKALNDVIGMLVGVVEQGFGKRAKIPGYYIAGKTGTAQIPFSALGEPKSGYSEKTIQSFVGFFPAFEAKILILVKLYNPKTKTAEYSALPIFRQLAEYIIEYLEIPPDYEE